MNLFFFCIPMQNTQTRPSYEERFSHTEAQISYRKKELARAQKSYNRTSKADDQRWKENANSHDADYDKLHTIQKKMEEKRLELHRAETQLKERKKQQESLWASDEDYYNQRATYLNTQTASRTEKYEKARAEYEKNSQQNQDSEKNQNMTIKAQNEMVEAQHKLNWLGRQKDALVSK